MGNGESKLADNEITNISLLYTLKTWNEKFHENNYEISE